MVGKKLMLKKMRYLFVLSLIVSGDEEHRGPVILSQELGWCFRHTFTHKASIYVSDTKVEVSRKRIVSGEYRGHWPYKHGNAVSTLSVEILRKSTLERGVEQLAVQKVFDFDHN